MGTCSAFIEVTKFLDVTRGRIDARLQFDRAEIVQAEARREVRPVLVIGNELRPLEAA